MEIVKAALKTLVKAKGREIQEVVGTGFDMEIEMGLVAKRVLTPAFIVALETLEER